VERFARHFKCRPDRLNQTHLRSYQPHLLRTGQLQPKTVRLHLSARRFFFGKTLRRRYLLEDTPYPKAPQRLPAILSVEEMARLIDAADGLYHRTMLMVLCSTGIRSAELLQLRVADVDSRRMLIHIRQGKGGRASTVSSGLSRGGRATTRPATRRPPARVAVLSLRRAHAHHRAPDAEAGLSRSPPRRHPP
jgi:integrase